MRVRNLVGLFLSAVTIFAAGCGGGGGSSAPTGTTVSGVASKGPILGGNVSVFEVISSATLNARANIPRLGATAVATATTSATDGSYALSLPVTLTKGSIVVKVTGGSYKDEATGATVQVDAQFANGLRAAFPNISGAVKRGPITMCATPLTELAYEDASASLTDSQIAASNRKVTKAFGLDAKGVDILSTKPLDANIAFPADATTAQESYTLTLATLSQYQKNLGTGTVGTNTSDLLGKIQPSGAFSTATTNALNTATLNFVTANNTNPVLNTPAVNANAPATVTLAPAVATTSAINTAVTVAATVKKADGTAVPDGSVVAFTTTFGTLSAASATTVSGVASVTLNSANIGSGTVTAKAGSQSVTTPLISFVDPNAPTGVSVVANPTSTTTGSTIVITATVTKGAGVSVGSGVTVNFSTTGGSLSAATAVTGAAGTATVNLTSPTATGSFVVTATAGSASGTATAAFATQPTTAVVTVGLTGTLGGATIGGLQAIINYNAAHGLGAPTAAKAGLSATTAVPAPLLFSANTAVNPVNTNIAWDPTGTPAGPTTLGNVETLTFPITAGFVPVATDFSVAGTSKVTDTNGITLTGVQVSIISVVIH